MSDATKVFNEIMATPDKGIPQDLLEKAHCIVIVPGNETGGVRHRREIRPRIRGLPARITHDWGAPAAIRVEGGSFGFQIGASNTDIVMLVMNERGMRRLLEDKVTLGGEATVAAGPVGRQTSASTDVQMSAEILSWSRSKGLFAGIALQAPPCGPDNDVNQELYGTKLTNKEILTGGQAPPAGAMDLVTALNRYSPREDKDKPIESRVGDADRAKTKKQ